MIEVPLGWGVHFLFGNAIAFAGLRLLGCGPTALAVAIASSWTIALWLHPWAWMIWCLEAVAVCALWRRASPLTNDLIFWIFAGAPLLFATYGGIMGMDGPSLWLVIAKQAVNGVANILIAELLYLAILLGPLRRRLSCPPVSAAAATLTVLAAFTLIPALLFLWIDGRERAAEVLRLGRGNLAAAAQTGDAALASWLDSRRFALAALGRAAAADDGRDLSHAELGPLADEFDAIFVFDLQGRILAQHGTQALPPPLPPERLRAIAEAGTTLTDLHGGGGGSGTAQHLDLIIALPGTGGVYATLSREAFSRAFDILDVRNHGVILLDRRGGVAAEVGSAVATDRIRRALAEGGPAALAGGPHLLTARGFGTSLMTSYRDVAMAAARPVAAVPGWTAIGAFLPNQEILAARAVQFRLFLTIVGFVAAAILAGIWIAGRIGGALSRMADAAVGLTEGGAAAAARASGSVEELMRIRRGVRFAEDAIRSEREAAELYRRQVEQILRHAPIILYALSLQEDRRGRLESISGSVERILGFSEREVRQPGWWSRAVHPDDAASVRTAFAELARRPSVSHEYRLRGSDGRYRWVFNTLVAMPAPDGRTAQATGVLIDITDRKEAQLQLLQASKLASLGEMATGIAHELNQPLSTIKLAATNLANRLAAGDMAAEEFRHRLNRIVGQADRASAVISHMRLFGRQGGGPPGPVDVGVAIAGAVTMLEQQLKAGGIGLETRVAESLPPVLGHQVQLEQVLINLLLNARDAIGAGGTGSGRIEVAADRQGRDIRITVTDDGGGIPEALLSRVFEPFFTTKAVNAGLGLGLSISYGIVRDMGGRITAGNGPDGAIFTIELPAIEGCKDTAGEGAAAAPRPSPATTEEAR